MTEFRSLAKFILKWKKTGKYLQTRKKRELLSDYVFILSNTGIRHGTEMLNLKWKHIEWFIGENSKRYLQITVSGKTGNRQLIARHSTIVYLKNIQSRFENLNDISFDELLNRKIDQYVIRLRDGTRPKSLDKSFRQLLTDSGLLYGTTSDMPRTLYSLRHFYATYQLMKGRNIHSLARQMGTSVGMIEQHYSKLTPMLMAEEFAGDD
jgi:integrase